jgi:hypothetical protein
MSVLVDGARGEYGEVRRSARCDLAQVVGEMRANTANASCGEVEHARQPVGTMRRLRTLCATGGSQSPLRRGVPERERALRACEQSSATLEFAGGIGEIRIR